MKIKTKVSVFFILSLSIFAYIVIWAVTSSYRQEVVRLNQEVSKERIVRLMDFIRDQDNLFFDKIYKTEKEAQEKVVASVRDGYPEQSEILQYLFIVSSDSRYVVHPQVPSGGIFIWDRSTVAKMLKSGSGEMVFHDITGRKIVYYESFKPWDWLICYAIPYEIIEESPKVFESYLRQSLTVIACMFVAVGLMLWLIQRALSPLDNLVASTQELAAGEFSPKKTVKYLNDEVGMLAKAFDNMAMKVKESLQRLHVENEERRNKEKEFRDLIDNSPLAMVVINSDQSYLSNEMFNRLFGYNDKEIKTFDDWFRLVFPDATYRHSVQTNWKRHVKAGSFGGETFKVTCKSGEILDVEVRHKLIGNRNLLIFNDLSLRKRVELELRNTRNYLFQVINSIKLLLVAFDEKGDVTQWNRPMEEYTGIKSEYAVGGRIWQLAPFLLPYQKQIENALQRHEQVELFRESVMTKEREYFNISISPLHSETPGAVVIMEDVTELIKKREQLVQAQKMETVGTLAGGLAHDFNNILGGIKGSISMINYNLKSEQINIQEVKDFLVIAERSVSRATHMVEQLLTLSRRSQLNIRPIDLKNAITNIVEVCCGSFDKNVKISFITSFEQAIMEGDQAQIEQVLLNLLINAEHSMTVMRSPHEILGGEISIMLDQSVRLGKKGENDGSMQTYWRLTVQDRGVGIPPDILPKIFDPFFTTKSKGRGTGLGLAMVYGIVDSHNGIVEAVSEPGAGSAFTVLLPVLSQKEITSELIVDSDELVPGTGTILIIDDEEAIRVTVAKMLETMGYTAIAAEDGETGADVYEKRHKEVVAVMLDMAMPGVSGLETYKRLATINPSVKVLIASGYTNDSRVTKTIELGARGFIQKPFSMNALSVKISAVIKGT